MSSYKTEDLLYMLMQLSRQLAVRFETDVGLSPSRLGLLCQLSRDKEVSQSELQKAVCIDPAAITRHVQQLEAEGVLIRTRSKEDSRITLVRLTDQGKDWIEDCRRQKDEFLERLQGGLSAEEQKELLRMLAVLSRSLEP
ncbi:MarR family transcriptional regulator [Paenibacillus pasadenensis]|uniref:MarR family winged helix-turn-helix transcriptional regulator n=1 Tax=Paenibacillus pasadenensis TaxID=217090 RepID=UPI0020420855|nr:MarR family transcriptional regulator [Paenibacillus pasadenensis]MCM3749613.1 MarR family transcriptional regulator [Paenibacillus pasadenensis]